MNDVYRLIKLEGFVVEWLWTDDYDCEYFMKCFVVGQLYSKFLFWKLIDVLRFDQNEWFNRQF